MLCVGCCLLFVDCGVLFVVLFVVCWLLLVRCLLCVVRLLSFACWYLMFVVCCLLFVVCCLWCVGCLLFVFLWCVVCCLLFVGCCWLFFCVFQSGKAFFELGCFFLCFSFLFRGGVVRPGQGMWSAAKLGGKFALSEFVRCQCFERTAGIIFRYSIPFWQRVVGVGVVYRFFGDQRFKQLFVCVFFGCSDVSAFKFCIVLVTRYHE